MNIPYTQAMKIAERMFALLSPKCSTMLTTGGLRRCEHFVDEIEIIVIPNMVQGSADLFGESKATSVPVNLSSTISKFGTVTGDPATDKTIKVAINNRDGVLIANAVIYICNEYDHAMFLAVTTAEHSRKISMLTKLSNMGWVSTRLGIRKQSECKKVGDTWIHRGAKLTLPPSWSSEKDFFNWLGFEYIAAPMYPMT